MGCEDKVTLSINQPPVIIGLSANLDTVDAGDEVLITCLANDPDRDSITYSWIAINGSFNGSGQNVTWTSPISNGIHTIVCRVSDGEGGSDSSYVDIVVENPILTNSVSGMWIEEKTNNDSIDLINILIMNHEILILTPDIAFRSTYIDAGIGIRLSQFETYSVTEFTPYGNNTYPSGNNTFPRYAEYQQADNDLIQISFDYSIDPDSLHINYTDRELVTTYLSLSRNILYETAPTDLWSFWADHRSTPVGDPDNHIITNVTGDGTYSMMSDRDSCTFSGNLDLIHLGKTLFDVYLTYQNCSDVISANGYAWTKNHNWEQILILILLLDNGRITFESFTPLS